MTTPEKIYTGNESWDRRYLNGKLKTDDIEYIRADVAQAEIVKHKKVSDKLINTLMGEQASDYVAFYKLINVLIDHEICPDCDKDCVDTGCDDKPIDECTECWREWAYQSEKGD